MLGWFPITDNVKVQNRSAPTEPEPFSSLRKNKIKKIKKKENKEKRARTRLEMSVLFGCCPIDERLVFYKIPFHLDAELDGEMDWLVMRRNFFKRDFSPFPTDFFCFVFFFPSLRLILHLTVGVTFGNVRLVNRRIASCLSIFPQREKERKKKKIRLSD